jgi:ribosomal protein L40E
MTDQTDARASEEKVCPKCAETIKRAAVVCRFCGHEFMLQRARSPQSSTTYIGPKRNSFESCMGCIGIGLLILFGLFVLGSMLPDDPSDPPDAEAMP